MPPKHKRYCYLVRTGIPLDLPSLGRNFFVVCKSKDSTLRYRDELHKDGVLVWLGTHKMEIA